MAFQIRFIAFIALMAVTLAAQGQYRQYTWFIGDQIGLDFSCNPPRAYNSTFPILSGSHSSISSRCGDMEVFSDGNTIRLGSGITVTNGTSLSGDFNNWQGTLLLERADSPSVKYLFTSGHAGFSPSLGIRYTKFRTSPMPAQVIEREVQLFSFTSSQITAARHANGKDWWVIIKRDNDSNFYSVPVSDLGLDTNGIVISRVGPESSQGDLKISPCGSYLALRHPLHLYNFDPRTGEISKFMDFFEPGNPIPFGLSLEFSQSCNSMFIGTNLSGIFSFNLDVPSADSLLKTRQQVTTQNVVGGMQLGPDGIIYIIRDSTQTTLAALTNPQMLGAQAGYITFYMNLGRKVGWRFPNIPGQELNFPKINLQNTCEFSRAQMGWDPPPADSVVWNFGDTAGLNRDTGNVVRYVFSNSGCFDVKAFAWKNGKITDSAFRVAKINPSPKFNIGTGDTGFCSGGQISLNATSAGATSYQWQDGSTLSFQNISKPGQYWVRVAINCCIRTDTVNVYIDTMSADFNVYPRVQCLGTNAYEFENRSVSPAGFTSIWDYGDGNKDTAFEPVHSYKTRNVFTVRLTTISKNGCRSNRSLMTMTVEDPKARVWTDKPLQCFEGHEFIFNDSTTLTTGNGLLTTRFFDFGDGDTSTKASNKKVYRKPGVYQVKLIAGSSVGCFDTMRMPIIVEQVKASLIMDSIETCERGNLVKFTDSSFAIPNKIQSRLIDLGNGKGFSGSDTIYSYPRAGDYTATIRVESGLGCTDSLEIPLTIHPSPTAAFTVNKTAACLDAATFEITNQMQIGSGPPPKSIWEMGDGTTILPNSGAASSFSHTYSAFGTFRIRQTVLTDFGCVDSTSITTRVFDKPKVNFSINQDRQCFNGHFFEFKSSVDSANPSSIARYSWNFGDNGTALGMNASRSYAKTGNYTVGLIVENDRGCLDSISKNITIDPNPSISVALADSAQCFDGHQVIFSSNTSIADQSPVNVLWDFGDGTGSQSANGMKIYNQFGIYTLKALASSDAGCLDSAFTTAYLWPDPVAMMEIDDTLKCYTGHTFDFSGSRSTLAAGIITDYLWNFSDGTSANSVIVSGKQFAENKFYSTTLKVTSDKGCFDEVTRQFGFYPFPELTINVNSAEQCLSDNVFGFNARGSSVDLGFLREFRWEFGDGSRGMGISPPFKTYANKGDFKVSLVVINNEGCADSTSTFVKVNPNPVADFDVNETCLKQPSNFRDLSSISEGMLQSWIWELGDASLSVQQNPSHFYKKEGEYNVSLRVVSSKNCQDEVRKPAIARVKNLPLADFTVKRIASEERISTYQFEDKSKSPISWLWDFGNGTGSTLKNPVETFTDTATLKTTLIVMNNNGCTDTLTRAIFVHPEFFIHIPNAFTPNRDFMNPNFGPEGSPFCREYSMQIFNRWGAIVFESNRYDQRWDGTYNGKPAQEGVYAYVILLMDLEGNIKQYAGNITLIR